MTSNRSQRPLFQSDVPEGRKTSNCSGPHPALKGGRWQQRNFLAGRSQRLVFPSKSTNPDRTVRRGRNLEPLNFTGLDSSERQEDQVLYDSSVGNLPSRDRGHRSCTLQLKGGPSISIDKVSER